MKKTENKDFFMYNYTKSAQDIGILKANDAVVEIIGIFERFNIDNDVYSYFGEKLLEAAKHDYEYTFTEYDLRGYLGCKHNDDYSTKNYEIHNIVSEMENKYSDLINKANIDVLRKIGYYKNEKYNEKKFVISYFWYTFWEIAKTYNNKNGIIVTKTPDYDGIITIKLEWSKKIKSVCDNTVWMKSVKSCTKVDYFGIGVLSVIIIAAVLFFICCIIKPDLQSALKILKIGLSIVIIFNVLFILTTKKRILNINLEDYKKHYTEYCNNINNNIPVVFNFGYIVYGP